MKKKERVLVGMSGGVDSSAVCMMLLEQGYDVVGITMRMWDISSHDSTTEPSHIVEARTLAQKLGIEHHTLDIRSEFRALVVQNFIDEYLAGRTPNPCVMCNLFFKWKYLLSEADRLHCEQVATGHYARIVTIHGKPHVAMGVDTTKDQSYFLWRLGEKELSRTLFPLGEWVKSDVKKYVLQRGYVEKVAKKESMEVCFIESDYRTFLRQEVKDIEQKIGTGAIIDSTGRKVGEHKGYPFYTIGQRKGLEVALGEPAFITQITPASNVIQLGNRKALLKTEMNVSPPTSVDLPLLLASSPLRVRIRYRSQPIAATLHPTPQGDYIVRFDEPASAITPGQSAVFYHDDLVLGGAIIE